MEIGCSMLAGGSIIALGCTSAPARQATAVPHLHQRQATSDTRSEIRPDDSRRKPRSRKLGGLRAGRAELADLI
jgi:hypothetical protein